MFSNYVLCADHNPRFAESVGVSNKSQVKSVVFVMRETMKKKYRVVLILLGLPLLLCSASALSNLTLPKGPEILDRLSDLDKARLAETLRLKATLGEQVWPGWGEADIPVIIWNSEYTFLTGIDAPSTGWEAVPDTTLDGAAYYRQKTVDPQNFAVRVGDRWAGCLATKYETDAFMMNVFRDMLPPVLEQIFPYRALILPSEVQMTGVLHETFHAYQVLTIQARLDAAEAAHRLGDQYWVTDEAMRDAWKVEIGLLARALQAESDVEARQFAAQFLEQRRQRRADHTLAPDLVEYERQLEWEEGLAKYVELSMWQQASTTPDYTALPTMEADPDFKGYATFPQRFKQEISQMKRQAAQEGETRFYYTGMAQAMLLDRLLPDWKSRAFADGIWLEDLLTEASQ
jgi:hypothetical protein